jgi:hypothetical protein
MADITDDGGPDETGVERRIVPAHRNRFSLLAVIVLIAFVVTCAVVFFGRTFGISGSAVPPVSSIEIAPAPHPQPQPTTP